MQQIIEINIEKDFPPAPIAVFSMEKEIEYAKCIGVKVLKVIHGYGSRGTGGEIKKQVHKKLKELEKQKLIKGFVKGECWSAKCIEIYDIVNICPSLIVDEELSGNNSGITIIFI